jgi:hypothetical protein
MGVRLATEVETVRCKERPVRQAFLVTRQKKKGAVVEISEGTTVSQNSCAPPGHPGHMLALPRSLVSSLLARMAVEPQ